MVPPSLISLMRGSGTCPFFRLSMDSAKRQKIASLQRLDETCESDERSDELELGDSRTQTKR